MIPLWPAYVILTVAAINLIWSLAKQSDVIGVIISFAVSGGYLWILKSGNFFASLGFPA